MDYDIRLFVKLKSMYFFFIHRLAISIEIVISFQFQKMDQGKSLPHPISSDKLRTLLRSFKVDFPVARSNLSAVDNLVDIGFLQNLVSEINSLSDGVVFTKNLQQYIQPGAIYVFEIHIDRRDGVFHEDVVNFSYIPTYTREK